MRRIFLNQTFRFVLAGFVLAFAGSLTYATELTVETTVDPYVLVSAANPKVNLGPATSGDVSGNFLFSVESNSDRVSLQAMVTNLYKDQNPHAARIPVNTDAGVDFYPTSAKPINGSRLHAAFRDTGTLNKSKGVYDGYKTEQVDMETKRGHFFNQDVELAVSWLNDSRIRPAGTYSGYIVLYVTVLK